MKIRTPQNEPKTSPERFLQKQKAPHIFLHLKKSLLAIKIYEEQSLIKEISILTDEFSKFGWEVPNGLDVGHSAIKNRFKIEGFLAYTTFLVKISKTSVKQIPT